MIRHLIVFNLRAGATHEDCLAMAERGREELGRIPGVLNVSFGTSLLENARYRYTFVIDLSDARALAGYQAHPRHVAFANTYFRPLAPDRITTDYEIMY
jgi:fructose-bisphosphate aldolase class II